MKISLQNETRNEIDVHYGISRIVFKMRSFIHNNISAKITKKIRWSVHESETSPERDFDLPQSFNLISVSHVNTVKFEMSFVVATQFWMHVNMRMGICSITSARSIYSRFFLYV